MNIPELIQYKYYVIYIQYHILYLKSAISCYIIIHINFSATAYYMVIVQYQLCTKNEDSKNIYINKRVTVINIFDDTVGAMKMFWPGYYISSDL